MCIFLKLDYAKYGVSNLFFQKLSKRPFGCRLDAPPPPLPLVIIKEGLRKGYGAHIFAKCEPYRKTSHTCILSLQITGF